MEKVLPKNWVETELENLFNLIYGKGLSVSELTEDGYDVYGANGIIGKYSSFTYEKSKVIISCRGAASGAIHQTVSKSFVTSNSIILDEITDELINLDYVKYSMIQVDKSSVITGTAQPQITIQLLKNLSFPLAPLSEQNRIVEKLDRLFGQLELIKTSMEKIPVLLKNFRQQVLTQAVTGKLTEEWREGKEVEEWKDLTIENLVKNFKTDIRTGPFGSALKKNEHQNFGVPVWGIESIGLNGKFTGVNKIYVTPRKAQELKSFEVKGGNIIISRSGTVGELCILPKDVEYGLISTNLMKIILDNETVMSIYFCWLFKASPIVIERLSELCKGSTRLFLTQTILKGLVFPIPSIQEQQEIVSRVESLFAKADAIEEKYKNLKAKIETLPQTILHKAFKGELSEQLETDGDARDLLEEIVALKNGGKAKKAVAKKYVQPDEVLRIVAEADATE